ncbi:MAG: metallophosphoesterase [Spirochaetaceae bacterium]
MSRQKILNKLNITPNNNGASCSLNEDIITIPGLLKTFRILHITDSHVSVLSTNEKEYHSYSSRMDNAFKTVKHYKTKKKTTSSKMFLNLLEVAKEEKVDLIVLTGDIVNNPSQSSISFIHQALKLVDIPYIYISGNHDWHYEGMEGSDENKRQTWINKSLLPLYVGETPLYSSLIIGGINFVAIDNSTYQVNEDQLRFYKTQLKLGLPIVLLLHIPLYLGKEAKQKQSTVCGAPGWGWNIDRNYKIEKRERWSKTGNLTTTLEFLETVKKSSNLSAVLAGHTHRSQINSISQLVKQYVTGCSAQGHYRLLRFDPLL